MYQSHMGADYELIETPAVLKSIVKALRGEPVIAVDLEADSMYHFQEKVCLLQLAFGKVNAVIDPLQVQDLSPLKPVFADAGVQKVFHGADYDVRSLYRDFQIEINNLFDTEHFDPGIRNPNDTVVAAQIPQPGRSLFLRLRMTQ